jgi:hypothetical protein
MARGWESKSVEGQISDKQEQSRAPKPANLSSEEKKRKEQRDSLHLARANTLKSLESATDPRYRALLEQRLAYIEAQLAG